MSRHIRLLFLLCLLLSRVSAPSRADSCPRKRVQQVPLNQSPMLKVLVPHILTLTELVNCSDSKNVTGSSIDVFESALSNAYSGVNWTVHYDCFSFPNVTPGLTYDDMIKRGVNEWWETSRLLRNESQWRTSVSLIKSQELLSLRWRLGRDIPPPGHFLYPSQQRCGARFWEPFSSPGSCCSFWNTKIIPNFKTVAALSEFKRFPGESIKNPNAHLLMISWIIFCLLLGSSYTAGLSSYLTAEKISPKVPDMNALLSGNDSIGFRKGSIVKQYLTKRLKIKERRLMPLRTPEDFKQSLSNGSVVAVFDEVPYVTMLLNDSSSACTKYETIGSQLTTEGFGFAFPRDALLASNISIGILNLSEHGCLEGLHVNVPFQCSTPSVSTQITLESSMILYLILGGISLICLVMHCARKDTQCVKKKESNSYTPPPLEPSMLIVHRWRPTLKSEGHDDGWT